MDEVVIPVFLVTSGQFYAFGAGLVVNNQYQYYPKI